MGGFFSKKVEPRNEQSNSDFSRFVQEQSEAWPPSSTSTYYVQTQRPASNSSAYASHQRIGASYKSTVPLPQKPLQTAVSCLPLMPSVFLDSITDEWDRDPLPFGSSYRLVTLTEHDNKFMEVKRAFKMTTQKQYTVVKIQRVENPFLLGCYLLKKSEMFKRYNCVNEISCFHGTNMSNVQNICENNFNWRLHGENKGNIFGKGVSFTPISCYASHYADKGQVVKVMIYARVLWSYSIVGNPAMEMPPKISFSSNKLFDTTQKENGHVIVKFCDNEFYPEFLILYLGSPKQFPKGPHIRQPY